MPMVRSATAWPSASWARMTLCVISPTATSGNRVTALRTSWRPWRSAKATGSSPWPGVSLYIAALGTLKHVSVFCPLFAAFGPEPIYQRLSWGDATVLVRTERLYKQKVTGRRPRWPHLQHILLADVDTDLEAGVWSLPKRLVAPMVVGVVSAMLLTLVLMPALYVIWRWHADIKHQRGANQMTIAMMTGAPPHA